MPFTPQEFVARWQNVTAKERSAAQSHFNDICQLIAHPTPVEADPSGQWFTFEAGANKQTGGQGWADVWKRGYFAWEYKGKHADLDKAYQQLLLYRESLQNPPLLIVSDLDRIEIHTNFTNTVKQRIVLTLDDLLTPVGMRHLKNAFFEPESFRSPQTPASVTSQAAKEFAHLADLLRAQGHEPQPIAHFLIRLLFCLFAEDIELLPNGLFTRLVDRGRQQPDGFNRQLMGLFQAMAIGDFFGEHKINHFDGGLFDNAHVLPIDRSGLALLAGVTDLDWSSIEPSIFGTLFERSLDPSKRSQLGAHYTSREDILLIVEPVLMAPLRRKWQQVQAEARDLAEKRDNAGSRAAASRYHNDLERLLRDFADELSAIRVLDPACGSANFLYVSLRQLLDLWKEVAVLGAELGLTMMSPLAGAPSPVQLYGIEINPYAHELAQATIWIGWIQWLHENGYGTPSEPILKPLDTIKNMDAVLAYDGEGKPVEPEWPEADVVLGNPPFLGDKKMREELGDSYTFDLRGLYESRISGVVDLVCYWFEGARQLVEQGRVKRVGLLSTNSIRHGDSRRVLDRIKATGNIFMAWSDRPWIQDGASVRVSIVGFDDGSEQTFTLEGSTVQSINSDLTASIDLTQAETLSENKSIAFSGTKKYGPFELEPSIAQEMLYNNANPNGRPNSDVIKPWVNGSDITGRRRNMWIIDFDAMSIDDASQYELPFKYVEDNVKPTRLNVRNPKLREYWWLYEARRPNMQAALDSLVRFVATPAASRHRLFVWMQHPTQPDQQLIVFAREDDYFFGVLHSKPHELWVLRKGARLGIGNDPRYTATVTLETFPFPWPPGTEPVDDPQVHAIAQAAKELVEKRDNWLNSSGLSESELKKRTLTNLYNARPTWLQLAHGKLDKAVFDAYGWPHDLSDEDILARLLALNLERAA